MTYGEKDIFCVIRKMVENPGCIPSTNVVFVNCQGFGVRTRAVAIPIVNIR